jgi:hypothetical protein
MKKLTNKIGARAATLLLFLFLLVFASVDANAFFPTHKPEKPQEEGTVGAPLDGGLLVLLAGAGITYFGVRRKKKQN